MVCRVPVIYIEQMLSWYWGYYEYYEYGTRSIFNRFASPIRIEWRSKTKMRSLPFLPTFFGLLTSFCVVCHIICGNFIVIWAFQLNIIPFISKILFQTDPWGQLILVLSSSRLTKIYKLTVKISFWRDIHTWCQAVYLCAIHVNQKYQQQQKSKTKEIWNRILYGINPCNQFVYLFCHFIYSQFYAILSPSFFFCFTTCAGNLIKSHYAYEKQPKRKHSSDNVKN